MKEWIFTTVFFLLSIVSLSLSAENDSLKNNTNNDFTVFVDTSATKSQVIQVKTCDPCKDSAYLALKKKSFQVFTGISNIKMSSEEQNKFSELKEKCKKSNNLNPSFSSNDALHSLGRFHTVWGVIGLTSLTASFTSIIVSGCKYDFNKAHRIALWCHSLPCIYFVSEIHVGKKLLKAMSQEK